METTMAPAGTILWVKALRAPFVVASVIPMGIGASLALLHLGYLDPLLLTLTIVGGAFVHISTNMLNDHFDFLSGNDLAVSHQNPFAGGGRVLPTGNLSVRAHFGVALAFLALGVAIGLYLYTLRGPLILVLGLIGVFSSYFYVGTPLRLAHHGVGEFLVGLNFGPVLVLGTYYVQTGFLDASSLLASIPPGLLVTAILWVNEFPDVEADLSVGKRTLMARLGREASVHVYIALVAFAYIITILSSILGYLSPLTLTTLVSVPIAIRAVAHLRRNFDDPHRIIPANAQTILLLIVFGVTEIASLVLASLV